MNQVLINQFLRSPLAPTTGSRVSQVPIEVLRNRSSTATTRLSQLPIEIIRSRSSVATARLSQIPIEILTSTQQSSNLVFKYIGSSKGFIG